MNAKDKLPPELTELEESLASRTVPAPPDELRSSVLTAVRGELNARLRTPSNWWPFAAGVAACLLLGLNLAMASINASDYSPDASTNTADADQTTRLVRELLPELTDEQARRHALTLTGAKLKSLP